MIVFLNFEIIIFKNELPTVYLKIKPLKLSVYIECEPNQYFNGDCTLPELFFALWISGERTAELRRSKLPQKVFFRA